MKTKKIFGYIFIILGSFFILSFILSLGYFTENILKIGDLFSDSLSAHQKGLIAGELFGNLIFVIIAIVTFYFGYKWVRLKQEDIDESIDR